MSTNDMTCRESVELFNDYVEGVLSDADRVRFEAHLTGCAGCRAYLDQIRRTIEVTGHLTQESIPVAIREQLLGVFRRWKAGEAPA